MQNFLFSQVLFCVNIENCGIASLKGDSDLTMWRFVLLLSVKGVCSNPFKISKAKKNLKRKLLRYRQHKGFFPL